MTRHGFYPAALDRNITPGSNDPAIRPRIAILHVDAGNAFSLYTYFRDRSSGIESHFHIRVDGVVEQYRSIYYQADANNDANDFAVSIETQGYGDGTWNDKQLAAIKALLLWLNKEAGIPLAQTPTWDGRGVGYHTLFGAPSRWTPVAKSCPGPERKEQFHELLVPWMRTALVPVVVPVVVKNNVQQARAHLRKAKALLKAGSQRPKVARANREVGRTLRNLPKK